MTKRDKMKAFWTIGEDLNWFGKAVAYTVGLPFLVLFTLCTLAFEKSDP